MAPESIQNNYPSVQSQFAIDLEKDKKCQVRLHISALDFLKKLSPGINENNIKESAGGITISNMRIRYNTNSGAYEIFDSLYQKPIAELRVSEFNESHSVLDFRNPECVKFLASLIIENPQIPPDPIWDPFSAALSGLIYQDRSSIDFDPKLRARGGLKALEKYSSEWGESLQVAREGWVRELSVRTHKWIEQMDLTVEFSELCQAYYKPALPPTVKEFLGWLDGNAMDLKAKFLTKFASGQIHLKNHLPSEENLMCMLSIYLGAEYVLSKTGHAPLPPKIELEIDDRFPSPGAFSTSRGSILMNPCITNKMFGQWDGDLGQVAFFINLGIHEMTHAIPFLSGGDSTLSEAASFVTQTSLGLPLRVEQLNNFEAKYGGIRNWDHLTSEIEEGRLNQNLGGSLTEYIIFFIGPWCRPSLGIENISSYIRNDQAYSASNDIGIRYPRIGLIYERAVQDDPKTFVSQYFESLGITDPDLEKRFVTALRSLFKEKWKNPSEFIMLFEKALDDAFGKPPAPDIPKGYAYLLQDFVAENKVA